MLQNLLQLLKKEFIKNILTLFTGNAIAQVITLISIPILTRLYSPAEFGIIALYISIVNILAIIATGRFDMAIVLPKRTGHAFHLLIAVFMVAFIVSIFSFVAIVFFHNSISRYFEASTYSLLIWILPLCIFLTATGKAMSYWFTRNHEFRKQAVNKIIQNASQTGIRIGRNIFANGHWGLFSGYLAGLLFSWVHFSKQLYRKDFWRLRFFSFKTAVRTLKDQSDFPLYLMPMGILNTLSVNVLIFVLSFISTTTFLGHYERALRVINFPLSLISSSFGNVFFEKLNTTSNKRKLYLASYFGNLGIAILILFPVIFWGESIFAFVLGSEWAIAGKIARVILPLTIFGFATECVSTVFSVTKKNQVLLIWQVVYLIAVLAWIILGSHIDIYLILTVYSIIGSFMYIILAAIGLYSLRSSLFSNEIFK